jgi:hypothetical protein
MKSRASTFASSTMHKFYYRPVIGPRKPFYFKGRHFCLRSIRIVYVPRWTCRNKREAAERSSILSTIEACSIFKQNNSLSLSHINKKDSSIA